MEQYFYLLDYERKAIDQLLFAGKKLVDETYHPDGYNIGINCGEAAGQTIFQDMSFNKGDTTDPRGGIRGVIPSKQRY